MKRGLAAIALSVIAPGALAAGPCPSWQPCNIQLVQPPAPFQPFNYGQAAGQGTANALQALQAIQLQRQIQAPAPTPPQPSGAPSADWMAGYRAGYAEGTQADAKLFSQGLSILSQLSTLIYHSTSLPQLQDIKIDTARLLPTRTGNPRMDELSDAVNALIDKRIAEISSPSSASGK